MAVPNDPISRTDLDWEAPDPPWRFVIDPNEAAPPILRDPLWFSKHLLTRAPAQMRSEISLHQEVPERRDQLVREVVQETLTKVEAITKVGVLTRKRTGRRRRSPSIDYICRDPDGAWTREVVTVVVRRCRLKEGVADDVTGEVNFAVTVVPMAPAWQPILRGAEVPGDFATAGLNEGDRFELGRDCDWHKEPPSSIFGDRAEP